MVYWFFVEYCQTQVVRQLAILILYDFFNDQEPLIVSDQFIEMNLTGWYEYFFDIIFSFV